MLDNVGFSNLFGRKVLGKVVINWLKEGVIVMVREVVCVQERGEIKLVEECMGIGYNFVVFVQLYLIVRFMFEGFELLCLRVSFYYLIIFDYYQWEL